MKIFGFGKSKEQLAAEKQASIDMAVKAALSAMPAPVQYQYSPNRGLFVYNDWENNKLLKEGFGGNATIFGMITTMAQKFASVPWILYKVKNGTKAKQYKALTETYAGANNIKALRLKASAFDEVSDDEHPLLKIFNKPNNQQTGQEFREASLIFRKSTGAADWRMNRGGSKTKLLGVDILPTQFIKLAPDASLNGIEKVSYYITGADTDIPLDEFVHWPYPNPNYNLTGSHLYGLNPLKAAARVLGADNKNLEAQIFTFDNKGSTGLFTPKDQPGTEAAQAQGPDSIREAIDQRANGREYGKARTFLNFPVDLHTFGLSPVDMESINSHIQSKEDLANVYNFPPLLIQMAKGTDGRYDGAIKYLLTNTIYSDLCGYRDKWNGQLMAAAGFSDGEYFFDFDLSSVPELQEDMQKLTTQAINLVKEGVINRNEARAIMKYDAVKDDYMNQYTVTSGTQPLSSAFEATEDIDTDVLL